MVPVAEDEQKIVSDLVLAAVQCGLPFEASPTGRWVRFAGCEKSAYVVRDAWGDGFSLFVCDGEEGQVAHFEVAREAVIQAASVIGEPPREPRARPRACTD